MNRQPFKSNQLQHALAISQWMQAHSAQGGLDPRNMLMEITLGETTRRFYPQFTIETQSGDTGFFHVLQPGVNGFVGWYPFSPKAWPIAQSKLEFKKFAKRTSLRTPAWADKLQDVKGAFLIKRYISSFGVGQRGPFLAAPDSSPQEQYTLAEGEYCEQFIMGQMLKAWYWCDELVVVELVDMPFVEGDGKSSVVDLMRQSTDSVSSQPSAELLALQGVDAQHIPANGERIRVAYQFLSEANPALYADYNCRERIRGTPFEAQLRQAGQLC
jgi:hypothetical protein